MNTLVTPGQSVETGIEVLLHTSVPAVEETHNLELVREKTSSGDDYYLLANGIRIRPMDHEARTNYEVAERWYNSIQQLYITACVKVRVKEMGPFD